MPLVGGLRQPAASSDGGQLSAAAARQPQKSNLFLEVVLETDVTAPHLRNGAKRRSDALTSTRLATGRFDASLLLHEVKQ